MKALVCEMCNSSEIVKQDGYFVCQHCGMKYAPEEAKKMMIDGPVTVTGTVSIDNSGSYERILSLARDAFADRSYDKAYEYYCQAVEIKPDVAENVLRQGLSFLGKEGIQATVPSSCIKRMTRALELLNKMPDSDEKKRLPGVFLEDINFVCDTVKALLEEDINNLQNEKLQMRSSADILADLNRPMLVASQNQAEDKRIIRHNEKIDEKISAIRTRISKLDEFRQEYSEKLAKLLGEDQIVAIGVDHIQNGAYEAAITCFDKYIKTKPTALVGYLGKAAALLGAEKFEEAAKQTESAARYRPTENEKKHIDILINMKLSEFQRTLLINAAGWCKYEAVKLLVDLGSDVNAKQKTGTTALWFASYIKDANKMKADAWIKIAELLLDKGASIDVTATSGVHQGISLYNKKTPPKIKAMIRAKYPNAQMGTAQKGCYVATAVYGSYDCPQVWTLRRYRDHILAKTLLGRLFIRTYYTFSPTLVKWFGNTGWFKKLWKRPLDRMVSKLQDQGMESTPYEDQNW